MSTLSTIYDDGHEYDLLSPVKAGPEETAFYARYGHSVAGPTLELACGTGRLTIALSQSGIDIVGIDIARSMLSVAREKAKQAGASARFFEADMRQFSLAGRFGLIFIPNNSIAHLYTLDDFRSCLACVRLQAAGARVPRK